MELKRKPTDAAAGNYTVWMEAGSDNDELCLCDMGKARSTLQCAIDLMLTSNKSFTRRLRVPSLNTDTFLAARVNGFV